MTSFYRLPSTTILQTLKNNSTPIKPFSQLPNSNEPLLFYNSGAMFRAMSLRKVHRGYEPLVTEPDALDLLSSEAKMLRSTTLPAHFFGDISVKFVLDPKGSGKKADSIEKQVKKVSRLHPLFSLFGRRSRRKKATAKPEFSRYMQYLKEGGVWNANSTKPVIY
ncbi:hypothetical protein SSX86_019190 [Deinandra increscens subsp. villosa]|uniref:Uncharacterized protein n=1 Tax=Deinandra increscens subsp. villosa TaxID=3103831 RepID=A0AAP0CS51_9ASTR